MSSRKGNFGKRSFPVPFVTAKSRGFPVFKRVTGNGVKWQTMEGTMDNTKKPENGSLDEAVKILATGIVRARAKKKESK